MKQIRKTDNPQMLLTIIIPVFNESNTIELFFLRLKEILPIINKNYKVHVLFVNDGSTDNSYNIICELREKYSFVYVISLSSNVGHQKAIECGLRNAIGDLFVVTDVDCQDPPEMILEFLELHEEGFDLVYGIRSDRDEQWVIKRLRKFFYHVVKRVSDDDAILYMAEFALLTSEVRSAVVDSKDSFPFLRSSIARVGFKRIGISYKRQQRIAGKTHFNLRKMAVFAIAGVLASTTLPLRLPVYILPIWTLSILLIVFAFYQTYHYFFMLLFILLICLYIGGTLSVIALYQGRIYKNSLRRPNYFIQKRFSYLQDSTPVFD